MEKKTDSAKGVALWLFVVVLILLIILGGITLVQKKNENTSNIIALDNTAVSEFTEIQTEPATDAPTEAEAEAADADIVTTVSYKNKGDFGNIEIDSENALLCSPGGEELFSKKHNERTSPASLTKIMTAIVALENVYDIDETIMITGDVYDKVNSENGSVAGFAEYEVVSYRDMLYGALLSSGAECCLTLANYVAGSEWEFVQMMNSKAEELGMNDTNFTNVCGFYNIDHYSTASDISLLLRYALENDTFYEIFNSKSYYTETSEHPTGITLTSTMFSEMDSADVNGGEIIGGKTGFTDEAGLCLASAARINGELYTLVTMGASGTHYTEPLHIYDAVKIYDCIIGE